MTTTKITSSGAFSPESAGMDMAIKRGFQHAFQQLWWQAVQPPSHLEGHNYPPVAGRSKGAVSPHRGGRKLTRDQLKILTDQSIVHEQGRSIKSLDSRQWRLMN